MSGVGEARQEPQTIEEINALIQQAATKPTDDEGNRKYLVIGDGNRIELRPLKWHEKVAATLWGGGPKLKNIMAHFAEHQAEGLNTAQLQAVTTEYLKKRVTLQSGSSSTPLPQSNEIDWQRAIDTVPIEFIKTALGPNSLVMQRFEQITKGVEAAEFEEGEGGSRDLPLKKSCILLFLLKST